MISKVATSEIPIFWLVSVAEDTGLSITLMENPRQVFSHRGTYESRKCLLQLSNMSFIILTIFTANKR